MLRGTLPYPIIDLFAGPGGLGEGFASFRKSGSRSSVFQIGLSIEKDPIAYETLALRSFFRQFRDDVPPAYYAHLRGELSRSNLMEMFPNQAAAANGETWNAELGNVDTATLNVRVRAGIAKRDDWVLIGGPPCQAYSLVGRSRMRGVDPQRYERDPRHFLYREYLNILVKHRPPVFVMENVKGLLSATVGGAPMFENILQDLQEPARALKRGDRPRLRYRLHSIGAPLQRPQVSGRERPSDFVVRSEDFGIPQARHRIIIVGVRDDVRSVPRQLRRFGRAVPMDDVTSDLPPLRSLISRGSDSEEKWVNVLRDCLLRLRDQRFNGSLRAMLKEVNLEELQIPGTGAEYIRSRKKPRYRADWYRDEQLGGVCNHSSRSHLASDIQRYFFAAAFARGINGQAKSPVLSDFPEFLLPRHENVALALDGKMFSDRFRVQVAGRPATTVTSHIAKDGHYYIHPDPLQARSLSVREAARVQTFPDNYFFCGPRTEQYRQVGNAVPPLLAWQIAEILNDVLAG